MVERVLGSLLANTALFSPLEGVRSAAAIILVQSSIYICGCITSLNHASQVQESSQASSVVYAGVGEIKSSSNYTIYT